MKNDPTYKVLSWFFEAKTTLGCHSLPIDKDIIMSRDGKSAAAFDALMKVTRISLTIDKARHDSVLSEKMWRCVCDEFNGAFTKAKETAKERDLHSKRTKAALLAKRYTDDHYIIREGAFAVLYAIFHYNYIFDDFPNIKNNA